MPPLSNRDLTVSARISSTTTAQVFPELVTTTLYPNSPPTASALSHKTSKPLPAGAIAGGVVAGAMLAVAVSIGWIFWGKSIKRTKDRQHREAVTLHTTKTNTRHNASTLTPRASSYRPISSRPPEKQVTFAANAGSVNAFAASPIHPANIPKCVVPPSFASPSEQKPTKSNTLQSAKATLGEVYTDTNPRRPPSVQMRSSPLVTTWIPHDPFTSVPLCSTESEEVRQTRSPTSSILAALGHLGTIDSALNRDPNPVNGNGDGASPSNCTFLSRSGHTRNPTQPSRLSQASSGSAYSQPEDQSGVPIGFAYGGAE